MRALLLLAAFAGALWGAVVTYKGTTGPGVGKHIVFVTGDDGEYHSEEAMPAMARILAQRHGFTCTVLFSISPSDGTIDVREKRNIPGLEALDHADLLVLFIRWRDLPDDQMKHIIDYVESGRPVVAIRTGTHPFWFKTSHTYEKWSWNSTVPEFEGGFGRVVLGETWVAHHGKHGSQSTRGVFAPGATQSPILNGIADGSIWGPTDVYEVKLPMKPSCHPLVLGQVLTWIGTDAQPAEGEVNNPMMPIAWTNQYKNSRVFVSTIGSADDIENESVRRLLVNGIYWAVGLESKIPAKANVAFTRPYNPHSFLSFVYTAGLKPQDLQ